VSNIKAHEEVCKNDQGKRDKVVLDCDFEYAGDSHLQISLFNIPGGVK